MYTHPYSAAAGGLARRVYDGSLTVDASLVTTPPPTESIGDNDEEFGFDEDNFEELGSGGDAGVSYPGPALLGGAAQVQEQDQEQGEEEDHEYRPSDWEEQQQQLGGYDSIESFDEGDESDAKDMAFEAPLPAGWRQEQANDGTPFYANDNNLTIPSQWERPTLDNVGGGSDDDDDDDDEDDEMFDS